MSKVDLVFQESEKAFLAEIGRGERITDKAEKYIGAIAIIIGFKLIDLDSLKFSGQNSQALASWIAVVSFLVLGLSLVQALLSRRVLRYYSYPRGEKLIEDLRSDELDNDMAKVKIAKMYLTARERNALINDNRAKLLSVSGILIVIGFTVAAVGHIVAKIL